MYPSATVEFVGGPYDGYHHRLQSDDTRLVHEPEVPVSVNVIRAIGGEPAGPLLPCHSLAVYQLQCSNGLWRYQFQRLRTNPSD